MPPRLTRASLIRLGNGLILCVAANLSGRAVGGPALPVPCVTAVCGTGVKGFVTSGTATEKQQGNTVSVSQTSNTATLNWSSFNIGAGGKVVFTQPSSTSIALNRIFDSNPSSIFGALTATGQIYLINANGFLFGNGATVNVGGLLASSLNLTDATFASGILAPALAGKNAALQPFTDSSGNPIISGDITIQSGAQLTATDGGRLLLSAPNVTNAGTLSAPDGQVILAAGQKLYLQASNQGDLRGLVVEVDGGGTAANQLSGAISAARGNVTLTGLMVNQDGRISATTSVNANGSIVLQAADTLQSNYAPGNVFSAFHGGTVELGPGSLTEILPEYSDTTTAVQAQTQLASQINITGEQVLMHGATINAPSGILTVAAGGSNYTLPLAESDPTTPLPGIQSTDDAQAQIRVDSGTTINLSGSDAVLPMDANLVTVQLRSNQFADDPTQRGGPLQSTPNNTVTVTVDTRADGGLGTPIADVSSAIAAVGQTISQRTEAGGKAEFESNGDVVFSPGASINVSAGYTTYLGGSIQTTKLIGANGQIYDIGSANPLLSYTGVINPTFTQNYDKWGIQEVIPTPGLSTYQSTYVQGANAGSVQFAAPSLALGGSLQATTVSGPYQRSTPPAGGTLTIGQPVSSGIYEDYLAPSVTLVATPTPIVIADGTPLPAATLQLPASYLTNDGFTNTTIYSNTSISLPAGLPLTLTPGASLSLQAPRIDVDSNITALAGALSFVNVASYVDPDPTVSATTTTPTSTPAPAQRLGIGIGDGVTLDVSGQWTNDSIPANGIGTAPLYQNAGSINLQLTMQQSELVLGDYTSFKANGGAWLESGGTLSYGHGGTITFDASPAQAALQIGQSVAVEGFGTGTASGGTFALAVPRLEISQGSGSDWTEAQRVDDLTSTAGPVLELYAPLFSDYGFSKFNLTATGNVESYATSDVLTVASGTTLDAATSTLQLNPIYFSLRTGTPIASFTAVNLLPVYERPVTAVSLNVIREADDIFFSNQPYGTLDVQAGAAIVTGPGGKISLEGEGGITVAGTLSAPGGSIDLFIPSPSEADPSDTSGVTDPGYVPTLGINLLPTAVLDVSGTSVMTPDAQGLLTGTVLPGGTVTLQADRGTVIAEAGSTINIKGTSASLDVANSSSTPGDTRETVASAGGSLTVISPESISLLGTLQAQAGVGTGGSAAGGSLEVDLIRGGSAVVQGSGASLPAGTPGAALPAGTLNVDLVGSTAGSAPSASSSNSAVLGIQQLAASGIDSLTLRSSGEITTDAVNLSLARQLILDSPSVTVQGTSSLTAPYIQIGNSGTADAGGAVPTPSAGTGILNVSAGQLNLLGEFALTGAASATFRSAGDVQLEGIAQPNTSQQDQGSITTSGSLAIDALRVYPDTYTSFSIASLAGSGGTVAIGSTGASPGSPLSADGIVKISADNIAITGTLLAPFGSINLTANNSLTLASGSLISVSGAGLDVPFGQTELNQGEWIYSTTNASTGNGGVNQITAVPSKQITLSAPAVTVQSGAVANISGGGDLYAYEWVPGTGGTYDNLNAVCCATASNTALTSLSNLYAILPAAKGQAGPYDPEESTTSVAGQTIYLSGGAGIAAGYYALLPARYALGSGAVLIQLEPSIVSAGGGQIGALANGTPVIAGYVTTGTTGLHTSGVTEYEGVAVYPTGYAQQLASYTVSDAASYFGAIAKTAGTGPVSEPADAGTFSLTVTPAAVNSLDLQGSVLTAAASGGRGAQINLSAPDLEITGTGAASPGSIAVSASVLQGWNASSLTLGGVSTSLLPTTTVSSATSSTVTDNTSIAVEANNVTVDAGVKLTADQIELVALQSINIEAGASLQSTSGKNGSALTTLPTASNVILTDTAAAPNGLAGAALLSVSDLTLPVVCRSSACVASSNTSNASNTTNPNSSIGFPMAASTNAAITLQSGATLSSGGALVADAPGSIALDGTLNAKGASWSLSSGSIAFSGSGTSTDTLNIGSGVLADLQQAGAVRLASLGTIDIDAPVALGVGASGAPTLNALTLIGNSINNQAGGNATFGAAALTLAGNIAPDPTNLPTQATAGTGTLSLVSNALNLGAGVLSVNGFAQSTAQVAGVVQTQGAGYLNVGGNLTVNAVAINPGPVATDTTLLAPGEIGPTSASGTTLNATGTLTLGAATAASAGTSPATLVGGSLTLSANAIEDAGAIVAPSGVVDLVATTGNLHLASTASIDAAGTPLTAATQTAASPGGLVTLTAVAGNLNLDVGSLISVAGSATAPAGSVMLSATGPLSAAGGTATVAGTLDGAAAGNTGGSLSVDASALAGGLGSLASNAGIAGFSDSLNVRVRTGDLDLTAGTAQAPNVLTANNITLTADTGTVDIAGTLSAPSAATRGRIDLSGGVGVTLEATTGQLHADGSGSAGRGGEIDLNALTANCTATTCNPTGSITLESGSVITTNGAAQMGELVLRAPALMGSTALNGNDDVAINTTGSQGLGANVSGVGQVIIEPVLVTTTSSSTVNSDLPNAVTNATTFLSAATPTISSRLTSTSKTAPLVQAGIELEDTLATDTLTLPSLDLISNSSAGQVVNVAVLAAGGLSVDGTVSDGFITSASKAAGTSTTLGTSPSASFTLVAGADLKSANPLSVLPIAAFAGSTPALVLGPASIVRTGTGDIDLAAAGDIAFQAGNGTAATVYTAGTAGTAVLNTGRGKNLVQENFPTGGGNVQITAGADVVGAPLSAVNPDGGNYSATGWLVRGGAAPTAPANPCPAATPSCVGNYGINFDTFFWDTGALGGGDVTVTAGGKVNNLSAATADSSPDGGATLYGSGGGLQITAVGDIGSAQVYVADGKGSLTTNGGLTPILEYAGQTSAQNLPVGSSFALGDAQIAVWARQSVQIDAVYNPTITPTGSGTASASFFTYSANSGLAVSSTDGDVTFNDNPASGPLGILLGPKLPTLPEGAALAVLPASLTLQALQQDVNFNGNGILFPSSTGQLDLFAGIDIVASGRLKMADSAAVPTAANDSIAPATGGLETGGLLPFQNAIHSGDTQPALITAGRDIDNLDLYLPKAAQISAGRDITYLLYEGQNNSPTDTTLITAGRDITYCSTTGVCQASGEIAVGGQGSLDVFAGRNLDLGLSGGIFTTGNLADPNLPSASGADVTLAVGYGSSGADYSSFLSTIIEPTPLYQTELVNYVESQTDTTNLTLAQAETGFGKLSVSQQTPLIDDVFFHELLLSGRAANSGTGVGFTEGYDAINALYPGSRNPTATNPNPYSGNLSLISSQIYTLSGGNILILVPGGNIDVGLAYTPVGVQPKPAGELGIVAEGAGNIDIYAEGDVNVNSSRIFTLGGGNILIWSDEGSIDAGNGSKSSVSVPPPTVTIKSDGSVNIDYGGALEGSGIQTVQTAPGVPAGDVDLDAPVGTVNAGDAGISAAGNINIAAAHVIGALNISFGGTAAGVPSDLSGLAASLSGVSAVGAGATNSGTEQAADSNKEAAKEAAPLAQDALSWLEVFVTGLGEENCRQEDVECLKRQKSAAH